MKRIGIPGWKLGDNSFGVTLSYIEFIYKFGLPVILTPGDCLDLPKIDMLLAPGGADIAPSSYNAIPNFRTGPSNPFLEHFDAYMLPKYIEKKTPVFAICRSMQRIWAMYGGTIDQHNGWHEQSKNQNDHAHELLFTSEFKKYDSLIKKVTSRHHQCVDASESVPEELEVVAYAKAGNQQPWTQIVEIFRHKEFPIFAVQFHPEDHDYTDQLSTKIIKGFLS